MTDDEDETTIQSFLENEAAFGLIVQMDPEEGNIKAELNEKLVYSPRSIGPLLSEAQEAGVIEESQMRLGDHPRSTRYELTNRGKDIRSWLERMNIDEMYQQYLESWQALDTALPKAKALIQEEVILDEPAESWSASRNQSVDPEEEFADEVGQDPDSTDEIPHPDTAKSGEELVDVLDDEETGEDEEFGRTETWGTKSEDDDEESE